MNITFCYNLRVNGMSTENCSLECYSYSGLNSPYGFLTMTGSVMLGSPTPYWFSALTLNWYSCPSMSFSTEQSVMWPWILEVTSAQLALLVSRFSMM